MKTRWIFDDGTVVELGGKIQGKGPLAARLRAELTELESGEWVGVSVHPEPAEPEPLDLQSPTHVHAWVVEAARRESVKLVKQPAIDWARPDDDDDDERIY